MVAWFISQERGLLTRAVMTPITIDTLQINANIRHIRSHVSAYHRPKARHLAFRISKLGFSRSGLAHSPRVTLPNQRRRQDLPPTEPGRAQQIRELALKPIVHPDAKTKRKSSPVCLRFHPPAHARTPLNPSRFLFLSTTNDRSDKMDVKYAKVTSVLGRTGM